MTDQLTQDEYTTVTQALNYYQEAPQIDLPYEDVVEIKNKLKMHMED